MTYSRKYPATMSRQELGKLQVAVRSKDEYRPIENASIAIKKAGEDAETIETLTTDVSGQSMTIELPCPPKELSLEPGDEKPYAEYTVEVKADGFDETLVENCQLLSDTKAIQDVEMPKGQQASAQSLTRKGRYLNRQPNVIFIEPHTLYYEYPPKIPEDPVKELPQEAEGLIILTNVEVPEFVVVHDGDPFDPNAPNYFVFFKDYIKNVASSEIYATWPETTIISNVLAILSFTLNRVFTEWYRGKGFNFTITSSTAYDHKFMYGRNIFENISRVVDQIFINYITKPGIIQPLLTQYCDGRRVQCPDWMTQWGSKSLGDQGFTPIEILRNFYGDDIYIETAKQVSGIPASWPGTNLQLGSQGSDVRTIQEQLNAISNNYPAIPKTRVDGIFGTRTEDAVKKFQEIFGLPPNGIVDYPTWYKISDIYVAVTRIAELR